WSSSWRWATLKSSSPRTTPISSANSRNAPSSGDSPWFRAPPGIAQVPPWWHHSDRLARKYHGDASASASPLPPHRTSHPAAPKPPHPSDPRPHRSDPSANVTSPSPETLIDSTDLGFGDHGWPPS